MSVVARGHVRDRPFARTIYAITAKRFAGDLVMTQGGRSYTVTWRDGMAIAADSSSPADSVGRIALTAGLVTSTQLADAMQRMNAAPHRDHLEVLAEIARLSEQQVLTVKRRAFAQRAIRIFALPEASFVLDSEPSLAPDPELAPLSTQWLIYQGLRTHYSEERLTEELEAVAGASFRLVPAARERLGAYGFGAAAKASLIALGSQAVTIHQLAAAQPQMTCKALMAVLYALLATDGLTVVSRPAGGVAGAPGTQEATGAAGIASAAGAAGASKAGVAMPRPAAAGIPAPSPAPAAGTGQAAMRRSTAQGAQPGGSELGSRAVAVKSASRTTQTGAERAGTAEWTAHVSELILSKIKQMDADVDYYQLLDVARDASAGTIRSAYFDLAKKLHPDRLRAAGITDQLADAQRLFARINQAYAILSNPAKRSEYQAVLMLGAVSGKKDAGADAESLASRIMAAEQSFRRGEMAGRRERWEEAQSHFQRAVELNPDESEHHALLAWATWCASENKQAVLSDVKQMLKRAITLSPRNSAAFFYRGRVASASGDLEHALDCFRKVIELIPSHQEANLQVRLLETRLNRRDDKKSILDRLKRR